VIDDSNIDRALAELKRVVRRWRVPIVGHYRHDPYENVDFMLAQPAHQGRDDERSVGSALRDGALAASHAQAAAT